MPAAPQLSAEQRYEFELRGVLRLPALLSIETIRRARAYVQLRLARVGLWKNGAWNLSAIPKPDWPATGLKPSKVIGNKHPHVQALADEPALITAVAALLDGHGFDRAMSGRPQILITLPNSDTWLLPTGWHADVPRLASGRCPGVQLFAFLDTVEPGGGGTLVIAGSHRLLNLGRFIPVRDFRSLLSRERFFQDLYCQAPAGLDDRARLLGLQGAADGVALEVLELTGLPGDVFLTDLRLLHAGAPNAAHYPRLMATYRFVRADVAQELGAGYVHA